MLAAPPTRAVEDMPEVAAVTPPAADMEAAATAIGKITLREKSPSPRDVNPRACFAS